MDAEEEEFEDVVTPDLKVQPPEIVQLLAALRDNSGNFLLASPSTGDCSAASSSPEWTLEEIRAQAEATWATSGETRAFPASPSTGDCSAASTSPEWTFEENFEDASAGASTIGYGGYDGDLPASPSTGESNGECFAAEALDILTLVEIRRFEGLAGRLNRHASGAATEGMLEFALASATSKTFPHSRAIKMYSHPPAFTKSSYAHLLLSLSRPCYNVSSVVCCVPQTSSQTRRFRPRPAAWPRPSTLAVATS